MTTTTTDMITSLVTKKIIETIAWMIKIAFLKTYITQMQK